MKAALDCWFITDVSMDRDDLKTIFSALEERSWFKSDDLMS